MKKLFFFAVVAAIVFSLAGVSFAAETDRVVGDDIEIGEGEFKIISMPETDGDTPVTHEDSNKYDEPDRGAVVGDDIEIGEGEFKIISMPEVVGDDIEIGEGEAKIISIDTDEMAEGNPFNWPMAAGITGGVIIAAGVLFFLIKKVF